MIERSVPTATSHRLVKHGDTLYVGGLGAPDRSQDMYGQTSQVCARLEEFLEQGGSDKEHLLSATIYISDPSLKGEMNRAWNEWLEEKHKPTRATISVGDMGDNLLIEVVVVAAVA